MSCHFLLQEIFPTQGLNLGLPRWRQMLYRVSPQGSNFQGGNRDGDIEYRQVDMEGELQGKTNWEIRSDVCALIVWNRQLVGKLLHSTGCSALWWPRWAGWQGRREGICAHISLIYSLRSSNLTQQCNYIPKRTSNGGEKHKNFMRTFSAAKTKKVNYLQGYFFPSFKILMSLTCYCIFLVQDYSAWAVYIKLI